MQKSFLPLLCEVEERAGERRRLQDGRARVLASPSALTTLAAREDSPPPAPVPSHRRAAQGEGEGSESFGYAFDNSGAGAETALMKIMLVHSLILGLMAAAWPGTAADAGHPPDPMAENLFPPELILQRQYEIGLSAEKRESIMARLQQTQERLQGLQSQLQKELETLNSFLKKQPVDAKEALAQLEKVASREQPIRRAQLELLITLKNSLTVEQQAKLRELKRQSAGEPAFAALGQKIDQIKAGVEAWQNAGRDPSAIAELMQGFDPLMKEGKLKEAQALLDRALAALREGNPDQSKEAQSEKPKK